VDSFLLWRLSGGKVHATDATDASRTLLYDIHQGRWSQELRELLRIQKSLLPGVGDCAPDFGGLRKTGSPFFRNLLESCPRFTHAARVF
jgi:glycerol kinase